MKLQKSPLLLAVVLGSWLSASHVLFIATMALVPTLAEAAAGGGGGGSPSGSSHSSQGSGGSKNSGGSQQNSSSYDPANNSSGNGSDSSDSSKSESDKEDSSKTDKAETDESIGGAIGSALSGIADAIGSVISGIASAIGNVMSGIANAIGGVMSGIFGAISNAMGNGFGGASGMATQAAMDVIGYTVNVPGKAPVSFKTQAAAEAYVMENKLNNVGTIISPQYSQTQATAPLPNARPYTAGKTPTAKPGTTNDVTQYDPLLESYPQTNKSNITKPVNGLPGDYSGLNESMKASGALDGIDQGMSGYASTQSTIGTQRSQQNEQAAHAADKATDKAQASEQAKQDAQNAITNGNVMQYSGQGNILSH